MLRPASEDSAAVSPSKRRSRQLLHRTSERTRQRSSPRGGPKNWSESRLCRTESFSSNNSREDSGCDSQECLAGISAKCAAAKDAPLLGPSRQVDAHAPDLDAQHGEESHTSSASSGPEVHSPAEPSSASNQSSPGLYAGQATENRVQLTPMALQLHREYVDDVKVFVRNPVPVALGTLECQLSCHKMEGTGLFASPVHVWELRITDHRVKFSGLARFTNVNDASANGCNSSAPRIQDLAKNRLVVVAERHSRGFVQKEVSYVFAMADCGAFRSRVDPARTSHLLGKLCATNYWGTEFRGYDVAQLLRSRSGPVPLRQEVLFARYACSLGTPRQLIVAIPAPPSEREEASCKPGADHDLEELWKNDVAPVADPALGGAKVIPRHAEYSVLERAHDNFDTQHTLFFHNRKPIWDNTTDTHILDFGGRVTEASIQNFQLDQSVRRSQSTFVDFARNLFHGSFDTDHSHPPLVQFGRCSPERAPTAVFSLDVRFPFSILQAMQLALSSVEDKSVFS